MSFEDEFGMFVVLPDGRTFGEWAKPEIERAYDTWTMPPSLPALGPGGGS